MPDKAALLHVGLKFCCLLMDAINSPHVIRLFDERNKKWLGAGKAIK